MSSQSQSQSDTEENENTGLHSMCPIIEDQIEIVNNEVDIKEEEQTAEDIFSNDIILPRPNPISAKERRESKEKSKKELEEEEREKMQYVLNVTVQICSKRICLPIIISCI